MRTMKRAFTLVELLVVIAIISVLAALLLPALENAIDAAHVAACASNQKQVYLATVSFANDHDDKLPNLQGDRNQDHPYFVGLQITSDELIRWALEYCEAQGATDVSGSYVIFQDRGALRCPGSVTLAAMDKIGGGYRASIDYQPIFTPKNFYHYYGYNMTTADEKAKFNARFSRASEMHHGYSKAFFFDNLWIADINDGGIRNQQQYSNHKANDPRGGNVCAGDGAVKWFTVMDSQAFYHPNCRGPKDYFWSTYYASETATWWTVNQIGVNDPERGTAYGALHEGATGWPFDNAFSYYVKLWK